MYRNNKRLIYTSILLTFFVSIFLSVSAYACSSHECHNNNDSECNNHCSHKCAGCKTCSPNCSNGTPTCKSSCKCNESGCAPYCIGDGVTACSKWADTDKETCENHYLDSKEGIGTQCLYHENDKGCSNGGIDCKVKSY